MDGLVTSASSAPCRCASLITFLAISIVSFACYEGRLTDDQSARRPTDGDSGNRIGQKFLCTLARPKQLQPRLKFLQHGGAGRGTAEVSPPIRFLDNGEKFGDFIGGLINPKRRGDEWL